MDYINKYYSDNAKKLRIVVDNILKKFGGLYQKDMDDFYSLANEVFVDALNRHDENKNFDSFLYSCLLKRIKSEITRKNREKRKADRNAYSLDAKIDGDEFCVLEIIPSNDCVERDAIPDNTFSARVQAYLDRLSAAQIRILELSGEGYRPGEIQRILHMNGNEYRDHMLVIYAPENMKYLQSGGI